MIKLLNNSSCAEVDAVRGKEMMQYIILYLNQK
jgi:hypothetical protein